MDPTQVTPALPPGFQMEGGTPSLPQGFQMEQQPQLPPGFQLEGQADAHTLGSRFSQMIDELKGAPKAIWNKSTELGARSAGQTVSDRMKENILGPGQAAASIGSDIAGNIVGHVAAIGTAAHNAVANLTGLDTPGPSASEVLDQVEKKFHYEPTAGKPLKDLVDTIWGKTIGPIQKFVGSEVEDVTGSKYAGKLTSDLTGYIAPEPLGRVANLPLKAGEAIVKAVVKGKPATPSVDVSRNPGEVTQTSTSQVDIGYWKDRALKLQQQAQLQEAGLRSSSHEYSPINQPPIRVTPEGQGIVTPEPKTPDLELLPKGEEPGKSPMAQPTPETQMPEGFVKWETGLAEGPMDLQAGKTGTILRNQGPDVFQGGPKTGIDFPLRQEVLDTPVLRDAIQQVISWHQGLTDRISAATDAEKPTLMAERDGLMEKFAAEMKRYGITQKSDAFGRKLYDQIPEGMWHDLRVKVEQQNSRQFAGMLANVKETVKTPVEPGAETPGPGWLRKVEAGVESLTHHDSISGLFPDQNVPVIQLGNPISINGAIKHALDIPRTLDHIIEHTSSPIIKILGQMLKKAGLQDVGMYMHLDRDGNVALGLDTKKRVAGNYVMGSKLVNLSETAGMTERVIIHELIHAATTDLILGAIKNPIQALGKFGKWEVDPSHPMAKEVGALIDIWKQLSKIAAEHHFDDFIAKDQTGNWLYGLNNPLEMIADIGVNPKFMKWVNQQVMVKGGQPITMLGRVRQAVRKMLGESVTETALDHIFFHTDQIVNAYAAFPKMWDEFFRQQKEIEKFPGTVDPLNKIISSVPGLEHAEWHQEPEPFEKLKDKILQEKDSGSTLTGEESRLMTSLKIARNVLGKNFVPGSIMASKLTGSTAIQNVGRLFTNAEKRANMFIEKWVDPIARGVLRLNKQEQSNVQAVFLRELNSNARYTPEQLKNQVGMSDREQVVYNQMRAAFDASLQRNNEIRSQRGLKPISSLDYYHAARWTGGYRADFVDANGKKVWAVAEKTYYDRQQAIKWIQQNHPDLKVINKRLVDVGKKVNTLEAGYLEMMDFLDKEDPRTASIKSAFEDMINSTTENVAGHERHFLVKSGVRGYLGDRPWANKDTTDFFDEQLKYLEGSAKWSEFQSAHGEATKYTTDDKIREAQPNNVAFMEDYIRTKMGFSTNKHMAALENMVAGIFGVSPGTAMKILTTGKEVFYIAELAIKLPFIEISLLQHLFSASQHAMLDAQGYRSKTGRYIFDGIQYGTQHAMLDAKEFGLSANPNIPGLQWIKPFEDHWASAREYAHANGILEQNPLLEAKDIRKGYLHNTVEAVGNFTTAATEKVARGWTFYSFVSHLAESGKFDLKSKDSLKEMFRIAEDSTNITMADYRATERSMAYSKMGLMGRAASALKTYPTNMMAQLLLYGKMAREGNMKPLTMFLAAQAMVGGLRGMFAVDDVDAMWQFFKRHWPFPKEWFESVKDWGIKKSLAYHLPDWAYHGPIAAVTGNNISVQGSMGRVVPGLSPMLEGELAEAGENIFPSVAENYHMGKAMFEYGAGKAGQALPAKYVPFTPNETSEALYEATPAGLKGLLREKDTAFHAPGKPNLMLNPHKLEEGQYTRNPAEHTLGEFGYASPREQRWVDAHHAYKEMNAIMTEHRKEVVQDLEEYFLRGDTAQVTRLMKLYFQLGGDPEAIQHEFTHAAIEKMTNMSQQAALDITHSQNPTKVIQARDLLNALTNK